jgi:hypothetical protein
VGDERYAATVGVSRGETVVRRDRLPLSDGIRARRFPIVKVAIILANFLERNHRPRNTHAGILTGKTSTSVSAPGGSGVNRAHDQPGRARNSLRRPAGAFPPSAAFTLTPASVMASTSCASTGSRSTYS